MTTPSQSEPLDMTMMYAIHTALRRDLGNIARGARAAGDDPTRLIATNFGWGLFKQFLTLHHNTEDATLWPRMRELVADQPDELELLDAMEAEHAKIDPLLLAIDTALDDREGGHDRLDDLTDELAHAVGGHLTHEETDALPLIGRVLPFADWVRFGDEQRSRVGVDAAKKYLPWLLDDATEEQTAGVLSFIPPPLHELYRNSWHAAYVANSPWARERAQQSESI